MTVSSFLDFRSISLLSALICVLVISEIFFLTGFGSFRGQFNLSLEFSPGAEGDFDLDIVVNLVIFLVSGSALSALSAWKFPDMDDTHDTNGTMRTSLRFASLQ